MISVLTSSAVHEPYSAFPQTHSDPVERDRRALHVVPCSLDTCWSALLWTSGDRLRRAAPPLSVHGCLWFLFSARLLFRVFSSALSSKRCLLSLCEKRKEPRSHRHTWRSHTTLDRASSARSTFFFFCQTNLIFPCTLDICIHSLGILHDHGKVAVSHGEKHAQCFGRCSRWSLRKRETPAGGAGQHHGAAPPCRAARKEYPVQAQVIL